MCTIVAVGNTRNQTPRPSLTHTEDWLAPSAAEPFVASPDGGPQQETMRIWEPQTTLAARSGCGCCRALCSAHRVGGLLLLIVTYQLLGSR
jgi:hypothetical protein